MVDRIYITGPVGSGKSTLARRISKEYGFHCCELDGVVYEKDPACAAGNKKRPPEQQNTLFHSVLGLNRWVMEDAGRVCFEEGLRQADSIILLVPPLSVRKRRILFRWIKQNLHIEKCRYRPDIEMLKLMYKWTGNFDSGIDGVKERLKQYQDKVSVIRSEAEFQSYEEKFLKPE